MTNDAVLSATQPLRIARPSYDLDAAQRFWNEGVGLEVLWRSGSDVTGGHELLMLGLTGAPWHLELVDDAATLKQHPPSAEDLLVIYRGRESTDEEIQQLTGAGGERVAARNPYWDEHGVTIRDPDGYLLVLSHRTWD